MASKSRKLFKDISISNNVSRSGFDLSFPFKFSAKCGELLPIMHKNVMLGDKFQISLDTFTRTRPVQTAAYTSIDEYYDFFFVPYRVLGKQIPHIIVQDKDNPTIATSASSNQQIGERLPYIYVHDLRGCDDSSNSSQVLPHMYGKNNEFGFSRILQSNKLFNYLGYCYVTSEFDEDLEGASFVPDEQIMWNLPVSLLPLAAYQKIYYDFFRLTQWEDNVPYNYNFDYMNILGQYTLPQSVDFWNNPTLFDLRYANYPKDLFFGLLPDSQYGDTAVVSVDINNPDYDGLADVYSYSQNGDINCIEFGTEISQGNFAVHSPSSGNPRPGDRFVVDFGDLVGTMQADFSILEWRKSNFVQKYREILGSGRKDYKSIVQKIFNVDVPDTLTDMCTYLGGHSSLIKISEVQNTNLVASDSSIDVNKTAIQRGKGLGSSRSNLIEFEAKEPGIIMCIYHAVPKIEYALNAFHFDVTKTHVDDFANPVFDKLGFQEFPVYYLDNTGANRVDQTPFIGYTTRYFDYKTSIGMIVGDFRETLKDWVAPLSQEYMIKNIFNDRGFQLSANFFKVNPAILDTIFDVNVDSFIDTDQLRVAVDFHINAVRNLNYTGLPY